MDCEAIFRTDLVSSMGLVPIHPRKHIQNSKREKVNTFEHIYRRLLKYRGVLGITILVNDKIFKTSLPLDKAENIVEKWLSITSRTERDLRNIYPEDEIVMFQVSTKNHEVIMAFGDVGGDHKKRYGIVAHQLCHESETPKKFKKVVDCKLSKVQEKPKDPREEIAGFKTILEFRKKMWKGESPIPLSKDPQFIEESRPLELELLQELQDTPPNRGYRRHGRELEIFYHFLSRCKIGPPDAKTGKCKWKWLGKPAVESFGKPNRLTIEMAKEFAEANEEVEKAAEDIEKVIEDGDVIEGNQKAIMRKRIEKQKIKILMKKLEDLRRKRLDRKWRRKCSNLNK